MSFIVPTRPGRFEIRESRGTQKGPRSRTLATFSELTDDVIAQAQERAAKPPTAGELRLAARRVGAPVRRPSVDQATRELLVELGRGRAPKPSLKRLLNAMLDAGPAGAVSPTTPSRAVAEWMDSTPEDRGKTLVDLLLLADALPSGGRRGKPLRFPRLESAPA